MSENMSEKRLYPVGWLYWGVLLGLKISNSELVEISMEWFSASEYPPIGKQVLPFSFSIFFRLGPLRRVAFRTVDKSIYRADVCKCLSALSNNMPRPIDRWRTFFGKLVPRVLKLCFSLTSLRFESFENPSTGGAATCGSIAQLPTQLLTSMWWGATVFVVPVL